MIAKVDGMKNRFVLVSAAISFGLLLLVLSIFFIFRFKSKEVESPSEVEAINPNAEVASGSASPKKTSSDEDGSTETLTAANSAGGGNSSGGVPTDTEGAGGGDFRDLSTDESALAGQPSTGTPPGQVSPHAGIPARRPGDEENSDIETDGGGARSKPEAKATVNGKESHDGLVFDDTAGGEALAFDSSLFDEKKKNQVDFVKSEKPEPDTLTRARWASAPKTDRGFSHGEGLVFRCKQGTNLIVHPGVFEYADGQSLENDAVVKLEVMEFYDFHDILMAGLTTDGPDGLLETGGMIHLKASSSGKPLRIIKGKGIGVKFASDSEKGTEGMGLYHGVEQGSAVKWEEADFSKPTSSKPAKGAMEARVGSVVLLGGSLEGRRLGELSQLWKSRKLDYTKLPKGGELLEGTAQVAGRTEGKSIGGKVVFSNGVRLYPLQSSQRVDGMVVDASFSRMLEIESFQQQGLPRKPEEWFAMAKQQGRSALVLKHRMLPGGFLCKTPVVRNDSIVRTRFPWGEVEVPRGKQGTFFVQHKSEGRGGFSTIIGCLKGSLQVRGQLARGSKSVSLSTGRAIILFRKAAPGKTPVQRTGGLKSMYDPWEFGFRQYPETSRLSAIQEIPGGGNLLGVAEKIQSQASENEYYRSIQSEDMRRIERQFTMVRTGWHNLDKPGQREVAAKVNVDFSGSSRSADGGNAQVRVVYRGQNSCALVDGESWIPSGEALLVGVDYDKQTLRPSLDFARVTIRPGENTFPLALGKKKSEDLRDTLATWRAIK
jgi:hypothetical protein